ncbi:type ISP restriction/modification enzyme [Amycolatopsis magusensis]|uniref:type ISP restriction/modification enzyme n=1 Tax=Amycolatopsis magusensis TaxID=882444 RepID=UPI0024A91417|nr:type ISP restriction/modification enzyme [Amycolatopsis magusensis]MDI5978592.1 N-6 DNA methylase [Amycolatopsis magusensis]
MRRNRGLNSTNGSYAVELVISDFGRAVTRKLRTGQGSPEDHLRGPFEKMLAGMASSLGLSITTIGETRLPDLSIRPDYAVNVEGARVGYVELKKPGHGIPDTWTRATKHDREQWEKFQLLPNVLYSDGEQFAQYSYGKLQKEVATLAPGLHRAGEKLHAVGSGFARVMTDFLLWEPSRPRTIGELIRIVSNLCRLLRDDVVAELVREQLGHSKSSTFSGLARDWRQILFPNLTDAQFADQYAQTITFALLLARVEGVSFAGRSIEEIARLLGKKHSLMGRALTVLTDQPEEEHSVALTTMLRVLSVVDWAEFPDDSYAMLYEDFLAEYDPGLRRQSGVYYTPVGLVSFMTRFVDEILRKRLGRRLGFAERDVIVVDPAMGTGSFLAEVINTVATTMLDEEGPGAVAPHLRELSSRLIGFENQAAPYAIAELRMHSLLKKRHRAEVPRDERRFLADALDDPDAQTLPLGRMYEAIERSRRGANLVKRQEPVMVVIGNPPYADKAKGQAKWIEDSAQGRDVPSLRAFRQTGNGRREYVLSNKYVYFWRWATWKAFDAHPGHPAGVVAFVCSAGFLASGGFAGMRRYLRETADEGWIVDLTPEGHQPPMDTRFFLGNQQPICVAVFIRRGSPNPKEPALVHRTSVTGTTSQKAALLVRLSPDGQAWKDCLDNWTDPFQVGGPKAWTTMPSITDLLPWTTPGVKPNRTWVYAPEKEVLHDRWSTLIHASLDEKPSLLKETRDTKINLSKSPLPGIISHVGSLAIETGSCAEPTLMMHRPFDRKWVLPDARLHDTPRPPLWATASKAQLFVVEQHAHPISSGPALLFTSLIPDMHCHSGRGGRVAPLYRDVTGSAPNIAPGLLDLLVRQLDCTVDAADLIAYLAAVTAHPGYTRRFAAELKTPGIRIPLTSVNALWTEAVQIGREVLWLHTYGERCADPEAGRPARSPRMRADRPTVQVAIPDGEDGMPEQMKYDESTRVLHVGAGQIAPVAPEVMAYEVSRTMVVKHWFGYRKKNPAGSRSSPLNDIIATTWTPAMTTELLDLLNVLGRCVELEPRQDALLDRIINEPLLTIEDLETAAVLPVPAKARKPPKLEQEYDLFSAE